MSADTEDKSGRAARIGVLILIFAGAIVGIYLLKNSWFAEFTRMLHAIRSGA